MSENKKETYFLSSLGNALKILDILSVKKTLGLTELSKISGINKSSVFKMLFTLESRNYVLKTADNRYCLGSKFSNYGAIALERQSITEMSSLQMRLLRNKCGETIYLAILNLSGKVMIIHREDGTLPNRSKARIGFEMDAYTTAAGKVLLAFLDLNIREQILNQMHIVPKTEKTISSLELLLPELDSIKERGYCFSDGERFIGYCDIAAPIFNAEGKCIAAISIVCHNDEFPEKVKSYKTELFQAAAAISKNVGY